MSIEESEARGYEMRFRGTEMDDVAKTVADGIADGLSGDRGDEVVKAVGDIVAENIAEYRDADAVIVGTTDRIVENLNEGGHAYDIVQRTADIVLDHIPGIVSMFIRRAVKKIVSQLSKEDRAENVIEGVGRVIGAKLVEGGTARTWWQTSPRSSSRWPVPTIHPDTLNATFSWLVHRGDDSCLLTGQRSN